MNANANVNARMCKTKANAQMSSSASVHNSLRWHCQCGYVFLLISHNAYPPEGMTRAVSGTGYTLRRGAWLPGLQVVVYHIPINISL